MSRCCENFTTIVKSVLLCISYLHKIKPSLTTQMDQKGKEKFIVFYFDFSLS